MKTFPLLVALILSALPCRGAEFDLGAPGTLSVDVPAGWTAARMPGGLPGAPPSDYTIAFKPSASANATGLVTFFFTTKGPATPAALRAELQRTTEPFLKKSVEKKLDIKDFSLGQGFGAYCVFTDASLVGKTPKAGDYKVMGSGQIRPAADLLGALTLLSNAADGPEFNAMLKIVESIRVKPKAR